MGKRLYIPLAMLLAAMLAFPVCAESPTAQGVGEQRSFRFADAAEGAELLLANEDYIGKFNQNDLDFRLQQKGATLEAWRALARASVSDWLPEERGAVASGMAALTDICRENGYSLPPLDEIIFIKTDMAEECGADGYTHGTQIYLSADGALRMGADDVRDRREGLFLLAHELFHCLTRTNPGFRADMYSLIGFAVNDEEFALGPEVRKRMINNPDVERHDACASFRIGGEDRLCTVVFYTTRGFERLGEIFFDLGRTGLVPVDDLDTLYDSEAAENFWEVFGGNTGYVIDPEEALADNFALALVCGPEGATYENPEIISAIVDLLKSGGKYGEGWPGG